MLLLRKLEIRKTNYSSSNSTQKWFFFSRYIFHSFVREIHYKIFLPRMAVFFILDHYSSLSSFVFFEMNKSPKCHTKHTHTHNKLQSGERRRMTRKRKNKFSWTFFFNRCTSRATRVQDIVFHRDIHTAVEISNLCRHRRPKIRHACLSRFQLHPSSPPFVQVLLLSAVGGGTLLNSRLSAAATAAAAAFQSHSFLIETLFFSISFIFTLNSDRLFLSFLFSGEFRRLSLYTRTHTLARRTRIYIMKDLGNSVHVFVSYPSVHNAKTHHRFYSAAVIKEHVANKIETLETTTTERAKMFFIFSYAKTYFQSICITSHSLFTIGKFNCHLYILCGAHARAPFYAKFFQTRKLCIHKPFDHQASEQSNQQQITKRMKRKNTSPKQTHEICNIYTSIIDRIFTFSVFLFVGKNFISKSKDVQPCGSTHHQHWGESLCNFVSCA